MTRESGAGALLGFLLLDKWTVAERLNTDSGDTGSTRSACYKASDFNGNPAFIKAFDFKHEDSTGDTEQLERMVREFNHEKNVHLYCRKKQISRVTEIYAFGKVQVDGAAVHYLICEWAPATLRRSHPPGILNTSIAHRLEALRDVASAMAQLHWAGVAHQDIKPSNAVLFPSRLAKLTDLGSSSCLELPFPPHDDDVMAGEPTYAPYELFYGAGGTWQRRRLGTDLYLLGNLIFTSFIGGSLTILGLHCLPEELRHDRFTGEYKEVIPYLQDVHSGIIPEFLTARSPEIISKDLARMISELCNPDPSKRGHQKNLRGSGGPFGLERYISELNYLATKTGKLRDAA